MFFNSFQTRQPQEQDHRGETLQTTGSQGEGHPGGSHQGSENSLIQVRQLLLFEGVGLREMARVKIRILGHQGSENSFTQVKQLLFFGGGLFYGKWRG